MRKIAVAGLLGFEKALELREIHRKELEQHFSRAFLKEVTALPAHGLTAEERKVLDQMTGSGFYVTAISQGGIFGALWRACEEQETEEDPDMTGSFGCEVDPDRIPLRQEVTEICELFRENPYEVPSPGARLIVWDEEQEPKLSEAVLSILRQSAIIGKLTFSKKRILSGSGGIRYLTPPARQNKDIANRKNEV